MKRAPLRHGEIFEREIKSAYKLSEAEEIVNVSSLQILYMQDIA